MRPPDRNELAAVVADGRAFDWTALDTSSEVRTMSALWRAVHTQLPGELPGVRAPRARLGWGVATLAVLALIKSVAALALVAVGPGLVNPMQVVTLVSFSAVGTALLYGGARDLRARHLGLLLLLLGTVFAHPLLRQGATGWQPTPLWVVCLRGVAVEAFLPAALWLFVRDFPAAASSPRDARRLRRGLRVSIAVGTILFVANLMLAAGVVLHGLWMLDRNSAGTTYYWPLTVLLVAPGFVAMLRRRRDAAPLERDKVAAFLTAIGVALLPALLVIGLATRLSPLQSWMTKHFALTAAFLYVGLVLMPLTTAHAVLAHRVVRIDLVLRNAARYALARGTLTIATAGPLLVLAIYVYRHRDRSIVDLFAVAPGQSLLVLAGAAALLFALRQPLIGRLERALQRDSASLATALGEFARRSTQGVGLGDVAEALQQAADAAFHPEVATLLVADRARQAFVPVGAALPPLPRASWIARALGRTNDPVIVDLEEPEGVARLLPRAEQEWLADAGVIVLVPLTAGGGDLCAILALGRMAGDADYADADLRFLAALAAAAAPSVEARLLRTSASTRNLDEVDWDDESGRECPACGRVVAADVNSCPNCRTTTAPMAVPRRLHGKFMLQRRLGSGGMGVVYLARDEALDRLVALKALPRVQPEAVQRLRREAKAMASVSHPAVATIHGLESWRSAPVLVVEYLSGGTLADRLLQGPMNEAAVIAMARQVLAGLGHLHDAGLLHRDLKPSNIGFTADGYAKLLDFGLSRLVGGGATSSPVFGREVGGVSQQAGEPGPAATGLAGTPLYISPDALAGEPPDARVDLWALAVVMREALDGWHPWAKLSVDEVLMRIRTGGAPSEWLSHSSTPLGAFLALALDHAGNLRPRSTSEFDRSLLLEVRQPHVTK